MLPKWVFVVAALVIAGAAFAVGQVWPGMGVMVVAGATTAWVAWVAARAARRR